MPMNTLISLTGLCSLAWFLDGMSCVWNLLVFPILMGLHWRYGFLPHPKDVHIGKTVMFKLCRGVCVHICVCSVMEWHLINDYFLAYAMYINVVAIVLIYTTVLF